MGDPLPWVPWETTSPICPGPPPSQTDLLNVFLEIREVSTCGRSAKVREVSKVCVCLQECKISHFTVKQRG